MSSHRARSVTIAATLALAVSATAHAANLFWQGDAVHPADLTSANYYNGSATVAPVTNDFLYIGNNGIATGTGTISLGKLYIGHNNTGGGAQGPAGPGTVSLTAGNVSLPNTSGGTSTPGTGINNFGTIVGLGNSGTFNLDGANTSFTTPGLTIGYGDDPSLSATLNITNSAKPAVTNGRNLNIGDSAAIGGGVGITGHVTIGPGAAAFKIASLLNVGVYASGSSYAQAGETVTADSINVAQNGADNCTFSITGGTIASIATGSFSSGSSYTANADNTTLSFAGTSGSTFGGFTVAAGLASNTTMTFADAANITVNGNFFAGRANSTNTTVNMTTSGSLTISNNFLLGTSTLLAGPPSVLYDTATGIVFNQSAGIVTTTTAVNTTTAVPFNFAVADTATGTSTYNLSGGTITSAATGVVGRQHGTGIMNQTGGNANFNNALHLGDQQSATISPTLNATGTYNLSAGSLAIAVTTVGSTLEAFSIAPSGTGTFRVIGGDASMTVTGNMGVYANTAGSNVGTLTFQPQPNEPLTTLNISGTATFNPGSILQLDLSVTKPTQGLFTVLNAASIVNNATVSLPAGWNYSITPGGNGQLLKLFAGDLNANGKIDADDYALIDQGYNQHLTTGANGDLNADGVINAADYLLIDSAFASLGGSFSPDFLAARESEFGPGYLTALTAAVPEPTSALACLVAVPFLTRRRAR